MAEEEAQSDPKFSSKWNKVLGAGEGKEKEGGVNWNGKIKVAVQLRRVAGGAGKSQGLKTGYELLGEASSLSILLRPVAWAFLVVAPNSPGLVGRVLLAAI